MSNIMLNGEQVQYIKNIVHNYISLAKEIREPYCCDSDKRYDENNNEVCDGDCDRCKEEHYAYLEKVMLEKAGLI